VGRDPKEYAKEVLAHAIYHAGWEPETPDAKPPPLLVEQVKRVVTESRDTYERAWKWGVPADECARRLRYDLHHKLGCTIT